MGGARTLDADRNASYTFERLVLICVDIALSCLIKKKKLFLLDISKEIISGTGYPFLNVTRISQTRKFLAVNIVFKEHP